MTIIDWVAKSTGLPAKQVKAAIELIEAGNTLPFIARYRKEVTDGLTDEQLEKIFAAWEKAKALEKRKEAVRRSLAEQKILTPALERALHAASTLAEVEDIYAPFRPKRKTRASIAKEKGLEGLAQSILRQTTNVRPEKLISEFVGEKVATAEEAVAGAKDIIAEFISNAPQVRKRTRDVAAKKGIVRTSRTRKGTDAKGTYQDYYDFSLDIGKIKPHQVLAINRAESEKVISFRLDLASDEWKRVIEEQIKVNPKSPLAKYLQAAIEDAGERLLMPNIERDIRRLLTEQAEEHAIQVFTENLRNLLLQPPITGKVVMGIDPGYRTGCKVAVVDATGRVLDTEAIYPHEPQKNAVEAARTLCSLILKHKVDLIAIGNGTASRETEMLVAEIIKQMPGVKYLIANEAGASVYSASVLARKELPNLDVSMRGAVSIARRVQDPLAELVKSDPKSIGVGM